MTASNDSVEVDVSAAQPDCERAAPMSARNGVRERLGYELYLLDIAGQDALSFEVWCALRVGNVPDLVRADRVLTLLEKGDAAAPESEGGMAALRLGLQRELEQQRVLAPENARG